MTTTLSIVNGKNVAVIENDASIMAAEEPEAITKYALKQLKKYTSLTFFLSQACCRGTTDAFSLSFHLPPRVTYLSDQKIIMVAWWGSCLDTASYVLLLWLLPLFF